MRFISLKVTILVLTASSISLSGCGENKLNRAAAAKLITETEMDDQSYIEPGRATQECLVNSGFVDYNKWSTTNYTLNPRGRNYINDIRQVRFTMRTGYVFSAPVFLKNAQITGVTEPSADGVQKEQVIEFTAEWDFRNYEDSPKFLDCLSGLQPFEGSAKAVRYDDGWRIEFTELPTIGGPALFD